MCSDPVKDWRESLERDLNDLYVPDLSVCDKLISKGLLSDDDWAVLHKTKRPKSKVKRLVSILCKNDDPRSAFNVLADCAESAHSHLAECIRRAANRFPTVDTNCNVYNTGVEHDETKCQLNSGSHTPDIQVDYREPVQHEEYTNDFHTTGETDKCNANSFSEADRVHDLGNLQQNVNEKSIKAVSQTNFVNHNGNNINLDSVRCGPTENYQGIDNNSNYSGLPIDKCLEQIIKGHGIQCSDTYDQSLPRKYTLPGDFEKNIDCKLTQPSTLNYSQRFDEVNEPQYDNDNRNQEDTNFDCPDGVMGFTNNYAFDKDSLNGISDPFCCRGENSVNDYCQIVTKATFGTRNDLDRSTSSKRKDVKRLKHLIYNPQTRHTSPQLVESEIGYDLKSNFFRYQDEHNRYDSHVKPKNNLLHLDVANEKQLHSELSVGDSNLNSSFNRDCISDKGYSRTGQSDIVQKVIVKDKGKIDYQNVTLPLLQNYQNFDSEDCVTFRRKICADNTTRKSISCSTFSSDKLQKKKNKSKTNKDVSLLSNPPRAFSEIDYCPTSVLNNCVNRTKSWAGVRRKSHIFDGFTSSSEDYTTTDLNYSDLNEVERELCDTLEKSGAITDIVDHLIQEEYFSNDDWCAINEIQVTRQQATYVAKKLSDRIRSDGCDNFSHLLKHRPELGKWLSSKFENCIGDSLNDKKLPREGEENEDVVDANSSDGIDTTSSDATSDSEKDMSDCSRSDNRTEGLDVSAHNRDQTRLKSCMRPGVIYPAEVFVDKNFQKVFDTLNIKFNNGELPIRKLPSDPNTKCIVLYLKACDALYKSQTEDAERFIELAESAVNDTDCPLFMRSEIFTQKTWLCLSTNRLGMMEKLLEENEQFLLANPNVWSNKAVGWFYFDYGRFNVTMMKVTKPQRYEKSISGRTCSNTAYEIYLEKAKKCLRKSIDYFAHSDSSDGPIGMGFSLSLLASIELQCVSESSFRNSSVSQATITEAEKLLQKVADLYDGIPGVLKASYLISKSDLCFRKNELAAAKEHLEESDKLSRELDLKNEIKECRNRTRLLNQLA